MDRRLDLDAGGEEAVIRLSRTYPHPPAAVWAAFATPGRMARWFAEVTGDLHEGGRYQVTGNAGGTITECTPERRIAASWEFGGAVSHIVIDLAADGAGTRLTLTHRARIADMPPGFWDRFGPGAVGVGWELGFLGLGLHLDAPEARKPDETTFHLSPEGAAFIGASAEGWGRAAAAAGIPAEQAQAMAAACLAFYTGTAEPEG